MTTTGLKNEAEQYTCKSCGRAYIVRKCEVQYARTDSYLNYCVSCQKTFHAKRKKEQEERENREWQRKKAENQKIFEYILPLWNVKDLNEIKPTSNSLVIVGNGFDLMHGVKSSYYAFRDTLGKNSTLRTWLESFWTVEDIWADLENGLAHFNMDAMGGRMMVDNWLDIYDAYGEDAGAAEFYMAVESAAAPMADVSSELPRRFREWIETLTIGTDDRPLQSLFAGGKVLSFNYTEFVETLYGVPQKDVCYIHGCRRKKKAKLILGHRPGASDESYELNENRKRRKPTYRNGMIEVAQERVFDLVSAYDKELTKDCDSIIAGHADFFDSISQVREVVVIGHSMSPVDWDYFRKIASEVERIQNVTWYIGVHGLNDLKNMEALVHELGIEKKNVVLFRTDRICVNFYPVLAPTREKKSTERILGESADRKWRAKIRDRVFRIIDLEQNHIAYEVLLTPDVRKAFFDWSGKYLFVIIRGVYAGVLLFVKRDDGWALVNELEGIPNQGILNKRLRKVLLSDMKISFVYNSRVRRYSLDDGKLVENYPVRNAANKDYSQDGTDVSEWFER